MNSGMSKRVIRSCSPQLVRAVKYSCESAAGKSDGAIRSNKDPDADAAGEPSAALDFLIIDGRGWYLRVVLGVFFMLLPPAAVWVAFF